MNKKYAVSVSETYGTPNTLVEIESITFENVEKAARKLLKVNEPEKYAFKLSGDYGGTFYRKSESFNHQIKVYIHNLIKESV
jgi:hypothetical protein